MADHRHELQSILVACLLAILPYLMLRGLVTRMARRGTHGGPRATSQRPRAVDI